MGRIARTFCCCFHTESSSDQTENVENEFIYEFNTASEKLICANNKDKRELEFDEEEEDEAIKALRNEEEQQQNKK